MTNEIDYLYIYMFRIITGYLYFFLILIINNGYRFVIIFVSIAVVNHHCRE